MKRALALDVGDVRIGIAVSDPFGFSAQPIESYARKGNEAADFDHIADVARRYQPVTIVFGMPRNMNGSYGPQAMKICAFADRLIESLRGRLTFDVAYFDERLTSKTAERVLLEADVSRKKRRGVIDKLAAAVILQGFLDAGRRSAQRPAFENKNAHEE